MSLANIIVHVVVLVISNSIHICHATMTTFVPQSFQSQEYRLVSSPSQGPKPMVVWVVQEAAEVQTSKMQPLP